jgi:hypothetical protein
MRHDITHLLTSAAHDYIQTKHVHYELPVWLLRQDCLCEMFLGFLLDMDR